MAISKEELAKILSGPARELCERHANETSNQVRNSPNLMTEEQYYDDDYYYGHDEYQTPAQQTGDFQISKQGITNSKLPTYIKESMVNHPIDVSALDNTSVLNSVQKQVKPKKIKPITENLVKSQSQTNGQIDYSIIKAIVNDCLTNFFNENGFLSDIKLKGGNILITDNKGETYVAKLEKINK
jgi:hypothetical protein